MTLYLLLITSAERIVSVKFDFSIRTVPTYLQRVLRTKATMMKINLNSKITVHKFRSVFRTFWRDDHDCDASSR